LKQDSHPVGAVGYRGWQADENQGRQGEQRTTSGQGVNETTYDTYNDDNENLPD
jgi:hypothetical protein